MHREFEYGVTLAAEVIVDNVRRTGLRHAGYEPAEVEVAQDLAIELAKAMRNDPQGTVDHLLTHVYFIHDTLTPGNVRATRKYATVPAVGQDILLRGAGHMGADATWRVVRIEWTQNASATLHMTDAEETR